MLFFKERLIFALLCLVGFVAIFVGTFLEIGRHRRGEGVIGLRHFRWRMASAVLWLVILSALAYGTMFEWPKGPHDKEGQLRMMAILAGSMLLMVIAMGLFGVDLMLTMRARQLHRSKFNRNLDSMAKREIDRARREQEAAEGDGES
jgi:hypothetical protein